MLVLDPNIAYLRIAARHYKAGLTMEGIALTVRQFTAPAKLVSRYLER